MKRFVIAIVVGTLITLLSTFAGERSATATYPDIMGCEEGCRVTATGWPFILVRDYTGMSVVNTANIMEVVFAADRLDWLPFLADVAVWSGLLWLTLRWSRPRSRWSRHGANPGRKTRVSLATRFNIDYKQM